MSKKSSLGRGLDALMGKPAEAFTSNLIPQTLPLECLIPSPYQPRAHFEPGALADLASSIREKGVLQPLLVRKIGEKYEIVAGERRWRASSLAGLLEVPVVVRELSNTDALEIAIIENLQREDLGPVEEARAFARLLEQGRSQDEVAAAVGKGRSTIANALRLLALPMDALSALENGDITAGHARAILAQPEEDRLWALTQILNGGLNVRQAEGLSRERTFPTRVNASLERPFAPLELDLSRTLGTKVRIAGSDKKGKLELSYGSSEELQGLLDKLGYEG